MTISSTPSRSALDESYMRAAIELARHVPQLPFGAVIVDRSSGKIIAGGFNQSAMNPTWHGEIVALNDLAQRGLHDRPSLALYTTAEPCPMCMGAILWSQIEELIYGTSIRFLQQTGWRQIDILASEVLARSPLGKCTIVPGVLEEECNALFVEARRT